jgi:hypothetical protein
VNQPSPIVALTATTRFSQQPPQPSSSNSGGGGTGTTPRSTAVTASVAAAMAAAGSSSPVPRQLRCQLVPGHRFTTRGRAPSTSGPTHVLHWCRFPSLILSSRPSSPSSSHLRHLLLHRLRGRLVGSARVLPPHGRPALLGHPVTGLCVQYGDATAAPDQRVVLRLRCYFPHDIFFQQSFTLFFPAVSYSFIHCCR